MVLSLNAHVSLSAEGLAEVLQEVAGSFQQRFCVGAQPLKNTTHAHTRTHAHWHKQALFSHGVCTHFTFLSQPGRQDTRLGAL